MPLSATEEPLEGLSHRPPNPLRRAFGGRRVLTPPERMI
nr:MAG TPA: hypothetical protein [Caudoviricetes sp.]